MLALRACPINCLFLSWLLLRLGLSSGEAQAKYSETVDPELVTSEGNAAVRFAVARVDGSPASTGYLYVSRDRVRYEIRLPTQYRGQGFDYARSEVLSANATSAFVNASFKAEFRFRDGQKWRFLHIRRTAVERGTKIQESDRLSAQDLADAFNGFDAILAQAEALRRPDGSAPTLTPNRTMPVAASLKVEAQPPGVDVYVDEKFRGRTSQQSGTLVVTDLTLGEHRVRLSLRGFKDSIQNVTVSAGDTGKVDADLVASGPKPLTESELQNLVANGVPKGRILALVAKYGVDFQLT